MPCPASLLLPRQPWMSPDPSSDIPAGPHHRATHSSCDSQPPLQSAHMPRVTPSHPTRLRQPDATPASGTRLPASMGGPGLHGHPHVGLCPWQGEDAQPAPPLPPASHPSCPQCYPGLADAIVSQVWPQGSLLMGVAQCGTAALPPCLTPRCCQGPPYRSQSPPSGAPVSCHLARRT